MDFTVQYLLGLNFIYCTQELYITVVLALCLLEAISSMCILRHDRAVTVKLIFF